MALQTEPGKQTPMRPYTIAFDLASDFDLIDQTGALDWTAAGTRLPLREKNKQMDDFGRIGTPGVATTFREGIYEIEFTAHLINASVAAEDAQIAITNSVGSTVHVTSPQVTVPASGDLTVTIKAIVNLSIVGLNVVCFRAAQLTAGTDITIGSAYVGMVTKVGNYNEPGPA